MARTSPTKKKPTAKKKAVAAAEPVKSRDVARLGSGQLRALVLKHITDSPTADFSPSAVAKALDRSSGAVGNALESLAAAGQAQKTSEKPRRYAAPAYDVKTAPARPAKAKASKGQSRDVKRQRGEQRAAALDARLNAAEPQAVTA